MLANVQKKKKKRMRLAEIGEVSQCGCIKLLKNIHYSAYNHTDSEQQRALACVCLKG